MKMISLKRDKNFSSALVFATGNADILIDGTIQGLIELYCLVQCDFDFTVSLILIYCP